MNYRHGYHVGNFADVFKHIILTRLIKALLGKEKPICYIDTHAGAGRYELSSKFVEKTEEIETGITKLMNFSAENPPVIIKEYLNIIKNAQYPEYYPGSPFIAKTLLRPTDRLVLMELQGEEYKILKENLKGGKRIAIHHQDGYKALNAFLPPKERRGLILIDPAFEDLNEWNRLIQLLLESVKKFPSGIYAIWYPLKDLRIVSNFISSAVSIGLPNILKTEFSIYPSDAPLNLSGCGMLIVNAPWQFSEELQSWLPWLWQKLAIQGAGQYSITQLSNT